MSKARGADFTTQLGQIEVDQSDPNMAIGVSQAVDTDPRTYLGSGQILTSPESFNAGKPKEASEAEAGVDALLGPKAYHETKPEVSEPSSEADPAPVKINLSDTATTKAKASNASQRMPKAPILMSQSGDGTLLRDADAPTPRLEKTGVIPPVISQIDTVSETFGIAELASYASDANLAFAPDNTPPISPTVPALGMVISANTSISVGHGSIMASTITASPTEVVGIISDTLATAEQQKDRVIVQLDPPELGRISIDFKFDAQGLQHITITGETPEAIRQLRAMHSELVQALEQNGLTEQSMTFRHKHSQNSGDQRELANWRTNGNWSEQAETDNALVKLPQQSILSTGLDIKL